MKNYWKHVGEHIENLGNMLETHWEHIENLGNMLETHWEHIGNPKKIH